MCQNLSKQHISEIAEQIAQHLMPMIEEHLSLKTFEEPLSSTDIRNIFRNTNGNPISEKTLSEWNRKYAMPHHKIGREVFYLPSEIKQWLNVHKFPTSSALQQSFTLPPAKSQIRQKLPTPKRKGGRR